MCAAWAGNRARCRDGSRCPGRGTQDQPPLYCVPRVWDYTEKARSVPSCACDSIVGPLYRIAHVNYASDADVQKRFEVRATTGTASIFWTLYGHGRAWLAPVEPLILQIRKLVKCARRWVLRRSPRRERPPRGSLRAWQAQFGNTRCPSCLPARQECSARRPGHRCRAEALGVDMVATTGSIATGG